jgi:hypothetical protein
MADTVFSTLLMLWGVLAHNRCALTAAVPSNNMIWSGPTHIISKTCSCCCCHSCASWTSLVVGP